MIVDSTDKESGDDEEFTKSRRESKILRQRSRLDLLVKTVPLHEKDGNYDFVNDFNNELVKKEGEMHKYTRTLFYGDDSWLSFVTKQEGDFFLNDLVAWDSQRLKTPGEPKNWIGSIPQVSSMGTKL